VIQGAGLSLRGLHCYVDHLSTLDLPQTPGVTLASLHLTHTRGATKRQERVAPAANRLQKEKLVMSKDNHNATGRREFLLAGAAAAVGFTYRGFPGITTAASTTNHHSGLPDPPGTHGMLLFGEKTIYLSHLPMFSMNIHRYQVILEVTLTKTGGDAQAGYVQDRRKHPGTRIYTFEPEPFVLPELDPKNQQRSSFQGTIFRGHFERGGKSINENVVANVTRVIHFRKFDAQAARLPELEYFLFGKDKDLFLAHLITRPPDFDQVMSISQIDRKFTNEELSKGASIIFTGKTNTPAQRIKPAQQAIGQVKQAGEGSAKMVKVRIGTQFYFEAGELAS
jgi:hypothetical protein